MHGPSGGPTGLELGQQGVLQEAPRRQHGQATGFVKYQQVPVIEQGAWQLRHGGFVPGGPMPDQIIPGCEGPIGPELLAVPADLTGGKPL
jgi:hypothetical protein